MPVLLAITCDWPVSRLTILNRSGCTHLRPQFIFWYPNCVAQIFFAKAMWFSVILKSLLPQCASLCLPGCAACSMHAGLCLSTIEIQPLHCSQAFQIQINPPVLLSQGESVHFPEDVTEGHGLVARRPTQGRLKSSAVEDDTKPRRAAATYSVKVFDSQLPCRTHALLVQQALDRIFSGCSLPSDISILCSRTHGRGTGAQE